MRGVIKNDIYWKNEKEEDRLRMGGGSWSVNLGDVDLTKVNGLVFCTEKAHYIISTADALAHGFNRTLGGESKLVVPVQYWKEQPKDDTSRET